jgi:hypothetical protein
MIYGPTASGYYVRGEAGSAKVAVGANTPRDARLLDAYPNPFNPEVTISFALDRPSPVSLDVTNAMGQVVATIADSQPYGVGRHEVVWRADPSETATGVYFVRLTAGDWTRVKKILLLR